MLHILEYLFCGARRDAALTEHDSLEFLFYLLRVHLLQCPYRSFSIFSSYITGLPFSTSSIRLLFVPFITHCFFNRSSLIGDAYRRRGHLDPYSELAHGAVAVQDILAFFLSRRLLQAKSNQHTLASRRYHANFAVFRKPRGYRVAPLDWSDRRSRHEAMRGAVANSAEVSCGRVCSEREEIG